jgi:hypothetical protein
MVLKWWRGLSHNERFVFRAGGILGAAGFVFGYDIGVVTGAYRIILIMYSVSILIALYRNVFALCVHVLCLSGALDQLDDAFHLSSVQKGRGFVACGNPKRTTVDVWNSGHFRSRKID